MTYNTYVSGITGPNGMGGRMIISDKEPQLVGKFYMVVDKEGIRWSINPAHVVMIGTDDWKKDDGPERGADGKRRGRPQMAILDEQYDLPRRRNQQDLGQRRHLEIQVGHHPLVGPRDSFRLAAQMEGWMGRRRRRGGQEVDAQERCGHRLVPLEISKKA